MKIQRQEKILEVIKQRNIDTQQMLADVLREEGFSSTQATISRDIRELNLTKELGPSGAYRYVVPVQGQNAGYSLKLKNIFKEGVTSVKTAQNLIVIKTLPGMASAALAAIDSMGLSDCVGTIAGDDTGFVAMSDNESAEHLLQYIVDMLK